MLGLITKVSSLLHQVLIGETAILLQLYQFWNIIQSKLAHESPYTASIRVIRMRLPKLQDNNKKAKKLRVEELLKGWKDIKEVFYYKSLLYVPKIICSKLINRYHNNLLAGYFRIEKI